MATAANTVRSAMFRQVKTDLAWFPGRFATTWRVAALCSLMAFVAMLYGIPESAISCYLILFVMKADAVESMVMAIAVSILVSIVVGLIILVLPWALESAPVRMAIIVASSFAFLWLGSASKLGPVGNIIALVIAFVMTLLGDAPNGELATRAVLYAWLMAVTPMMLLVGFNLFLGRSSWKMLRASVAERLEAAAEALRHTDDASIQKAHELLLEGQSELQQRALLIRVFHLRPAADIFWLTAAVNNSYRLLLSVSAHANALPETARLQLADACENAARAIAQQRAVEAPALALARQTGEIGHALLALAHGEQERETNPPKASFFAEDAFTNPVHQYFALKTTAASVICYLIYTMLDWQDIHTAMITCYVAALGTTGETVHKLTLRIVGCLIGAAIGVMSLMYIVPQFADIGQLMALIFIAILPAAWVSTGNERIAYAGIQIGLCFLLTVLHGFSPGTDLGVALDRILGILLGNIVVYVIFTQIWPAAIADSVRARIRRALSGLAAMASLPATARAAALREAAAVEEEVNAARESLKLLSFEPTALRPSPGEAAKLKSILTEIDRLCPTLFLPDTASPDDAERLRRIAASAREDGAMTGGSERELPPSGQNVRQRITRLEELLG